MKYTAESLAALISDARYQDIGNLPSNFFPYDFKILYIRPFTVRELRLISKAAVLKEMQHLLRAIDLVISVDINDISIGDFYYILMWLRIHSMPKTPYVIEWLCEVPVFIDLETSQRVFYDAPGFNAQDLASQPEKYGQVPSCGTHNSEIIHMSDVKILSLDEDNFESLPPAAGTVEFDFPRVRNLLEIQEAVADPELKLIAGPAQWIKAPTFKDKVDILEATPDLDIFDSASVLNEQIIHGIQETTTLTCRGCGIKRPHALTLDALSFFR